MKLFISRLLVSNHHITFGLLVLALLVFTQPIFWLFDEPSLNIRILEPLTETIVLWIFLGGIFIPTIIIAVIHRRTVAQLMVAIWPLLAIAVVVACSIVWSIDPALTMRRAVGFWLTTLFGIIIGMHYRPLQLMWAVSIASIIGILLSLIIVIVNPHIGIMTGADNLEYAWRGAYAHKSPASRVAGLAVITLWVGLISQPLTKATTIWLWIVLSFSLLILVLTSVRTTTASVIFTMLTAYALRWRIWRFTFTPDSIAIGGALLVIVLILVGMVFVEPERFVSPLLLNETETINESTQDNANGDTQESLVVNSVIEDTPTLNGRTELWRSLWPIARQRPIVGYGYGAFWEGDNNRYQSQIPQRNWASTAHNGLFEVFLNVGLVGVVTVLLAHGWMVFCLFKEEHQHNQGTVVWYASFLIYLAGVNLLDASLIGRYDIFWIITVAIITQHNVLTLHR